MNVYIYPIGELVSRSMIDRNDGVWKEAHNSFGDSRVCFQEFCEPVIKHSDYY